MAAIVKITGDTRDAQQKIQKLRKEVEILDKEAKKPKKVNVQQAKGISVTGNGKIGNMGTGMATFLGSAAGNMASNALQSVLSAAIRFAPAITRATTGLSGFGMKLQKFMTALEIYGHPEEEAMARGDKIDALDDERRSHNSKDNADEFGYSRAFTNVAGANSAMLIDRAQAVLDMATSGVVSEMEKAWKMLGSMGISYEDIQKSSTWEVLAKMLKAYQAAGADGENELEPAMQQIFGKRQIAAIRKIGDGVEWTAQAAQLADEYRKAVGGQEAAILAATSRAEVTRSMAEIHGMAVPESGIPYIETAAQNRLDSAKLNSQMLTTDAGDAIKGLWDEVSKDFSGITDGIMGNFPGLSSIGNFLTTGSFNVGSAVIDAGSTVIDGLGQGVSELGEGIGSFFNRSAPRLPDGALPHSPYPEGFTPLHEERLPDGRIKATGIDWNAGSKLIERLLSQNAGGKDNQELNLAMKDLTRQMKHNDSSTQQMTSALKNLGVSGGGAAYFA